MRLREDVGRSFAVSNCSLSLFAVQLRGKDIGTQRYDRQAARTGNRMQNYGQREGLHERQKEGVYVLFSHNYTLEIRRWLN